MLLDSDLRSPAGQKMICGRGSLIVFNIDTPPADSAVKNFICRTPCSNRVMASLGVPIPGSRAIGFLNAPSINLGVVPGLTINRPPASIDVKRISKKTGIRIGAQRLRQTTATNLCNPRDPNCSPDIFLAQHVLGHSSIATTRGYVQWCRTRAAPAKQQLPTTWVAAWPVVASTYC